MRVVVDRVQAWVGSRANPVQLADVGEWITFASREYNRAGVVFDPHQAVELTQRLSKRGVPVEQFNFTAASVGRLALSLYQSLRNRTLVLPTDPELRDELANVRLRETAPGTYRIDHDAGRHDDRAIALALAVEHLMRKPLGSGEIGLRVVRHYGPGPLNAGVREASCRLREDETLTKEQRAYFEARVSHPGWRDPRRE